VAQASVRDVCDMLMPLEAEGRTGLKEQDSGFRIRDSGPTSGLRWSPSDSSNRRFGIQEGFSFKFTTTLADLRSELGFRIVGYALIPQGGTVTYCSGMKC
jgi:hypothetical protein